MALDDNDDDEAEEGLRLLLGFCVGDRLDPSAWENESIDIDSGSSHNLVSSSMNHEDEFHDENRKHDCNNSNRNNQASVVLPQSVHSNDNQGIFSLAYSCSTTSSSNGMMIIRNPSENVAVINVSDQGRGNALFVNNPRGIPSGQVLYTERAAVAYQIDPESVRACQQCFKSLEYASKLSRHLPLSHLWPISEPETIIHQSMIQCSTCQSWFCSEHCRTHFQKQYGSCCTIWNIQQQILQNHHLQQHLLPPAIGLASRMLAMSLQSVRQTGQLPPVLYGLCGSSSDVSALELEMAHRCDDGTIIYKLDPVYDRLVNILSMSSIEKDILSAEYFATLACQAARNGFGIRTRSPFKEYYASLLRSCVGGRQSEKYKDYQRQVARALGSNDGTLERGMDRQVEEQVAPAIVAMFPLTARINHACGAAATAEVRSQEYIDDRVDIVARKNMKYGEEITISYLPFGHKHGSKNTSQRQRELRAKYLFHCHCSECCPDGKVV